MKICRVFSGKDAVYASSEAEELRLFPRDWRPGDRMPSPDDMEAADPLDADFLPPVAPSKIVCVGRNYAAHAAELNNPLPEYPLLFLKAPSAVVSEGDRIILPSQSVQVEHEGELGIVIGRDCKDIADNDDPMRFILGFVPVNDVTARDLQRSDVQFTRAKSFDTFCPVGRYISTGAAPSEAVLKVPVNGEVRQEGNTSDMIFDIPFLIRYISKQMGFPYNFRT